MFPYIKEGLTDLRGRCSALVSIATPTDRRVRSRVRRSARQLRRRGRLLADAQAAVLTAALATLDGDDARALACWTEAEQGFASAGMRAHRAAVCVRLAARLDAPVAERFAVLARSYFDEEGIEQPERIVELLAPAQ